jgi:hypothetical protein
MIAAVDVKQRVPNVTVALLRPTSFFGNDGVTTVR